MSDAPRDRWILLPIAAAFAGHARALGGGFVWDDSVLVTRWQATGGQLFFGRGASFGEYYRPAGNVLSYAIFAIAGGERAWAWHLVSILLHMATTAGVYQLLRRWAGGPPARAAIGALLFALWPTGMEAVTWASARSELLMAVFLVWAIVFHLRARDRGGVSVVAALLHLGALLSKEVGVVFLPLAVAATLWVPRPSSAVAPGAAREGVARLRSVAKLFLPHLVVLALYSQLRGGAVGPGSSLTALALDRLRPEALAPALLAWGWYVRECLLLGSGGPYVESPAPTALTWSFAIAGLFAIAFAADAARRPDARPWAFAGAWFGLALGPPLAFAAAPLSVTPVAIRYLYLPSIALCAVVTLLLGRIPAGLGSPRVRGLGVAAVAAAVAALLAVGWTWQSPWLSERALWTRAVRDDPRSSVAHLNLGLALIASGDAPAGEEQLRLAAWNPAIPDGPARQGMLVRVGEYYLLTRQYDRAREALSLAAGMQGSPAMTARARASAVSLEWIAGAQAGSDRAPLSREAVTRQIAILEQAAEHDFRDVASRQLLATLLEALGEPARALVRHEEIAAASFGDPARRQSALAAAARLRGAIETEPDPVRRRYQQAQLHEMRGETVAAIAAYREVLAADPSRADVWYALGAALESAGDLAGAAAAYETFLARFDGPPEARALVADRLARLRTARAGPLP